MLLPYLGSSHNKDGIIPNFKGDDAYETGLSHPGIAAWDRARKAAYPQSPGDT